MIKKTLLGALLATILLSLFSVTSTGMAHAATLSNTHLSTAREQARPLAQGGGCTPWSGFGFVNMKACISFQGPTALNGSGEVSYTPLKKAVENCEVNIFFLDPNDSFNSASYNCTADAVSKQTGVFYPLNTNVGFGRYRTEISIVIVYSDATIDVATLDSPTQTV